MQGRIQNEEISTIDGVKVIFQKIGFTSEKSNTEPIIRIYTKPFLSKKADELADKMIEKK